MKQPDLCDSCGKPVTENVHSAIEVRIGPCLRELALCGPCMGMALYMLGLSVDLVTGTWDGRGDRYGLPLAMLDENYDKLREVMS